MPQERPILVEVKAKNGVCVCVFVKQSYENETWVLYWQGIITVMMSTSSSTPTGKNSAVDHRVSAKL